MQSSFASKAQEASHATVQQTGSTPQTVTQQSRSSQPGVADGSTHEPTDPQTCTNVGPATRQHAAASERTIVDRRDVIGMASRYDVRRTRVPVRTILQ